LLLLALISSINEQSGKGLKKLDCAFYTILHTDILDAISKDK
jgi:hypothetical protein